MVPQSNLAQKKEEHTYMYQPNNKGTLSQALTLQDEQTTSGKQYDIIQSNVGYQAQMQGVASYAIFNEEDFGGKNIERKNDSAIPRCQQLEEERERQLKEFEEVEMLKLSQM